MTVTTANFCCGMLQESSTFYDNITYTVVDRATKRGKAMLIDSQGYTYNVKRRQNVFLRHNCCFFIVTCNMLRGMNVLNRPYMGLRPTLPMFSSASTFTGFLHNSDIFFFNHFFTPKI